MIKLQDFARDQGVTDRQIQRLLKKYEEELDGLYQRKGPNGTWLTEEACEILRSKMRQSPMVVYTPDQRTEQLEAELREERAKVGRLLDQLERKDSSMALLIEQNAELTAQVITIPQLEEGRTKAQADLVTAHHQFEAELQKKDADHAREIEERDLTIQELQADSDQLANIRNSRFYKIFGRFIEGRRE